LRQGQSICPDVTFGKCLAHSRPSSSVPNRNIRAVNRPFENVSQFKYLGTTVTNQNLIQEEIKWRLNSGNICYHSVQDLLLSSLLECKKIVILYGCETWCLTLRDEHRLRVFGNRVLRRMYGPKRDEVMGEIMEKLHNEELHDLYYYYYYYY
jgi:hypothetical protein